MLAKVVNDNALILDQRDTLEFFASKLAPTGGVVNLNARQHKGEPKLPFNFVARALFLLLRVGLLLFLATVALYRCFWRSPFGIKSKRIFLSADLLSR